MTACPFDVWDTSGWNWTANKARSGSSMAAIGIWSVEAVTRNPSGARVTASPWDIQTVSVAGRSRSSTLGCDTCRVVAPYSRCPVAATSPPNARAISWWP
jgi:hypothetical protein